MGNSKSEIQIFQEKIRQLEHHQKILLNKKSDAERKARTHRLIERGAILESVFPEISIMTGEQVKAFLEKLRHLTGGSG